jgi:hypothetical protein
LAAGVAVIALAGTAVGVVWTDHGAQTGSPAGSAAAAETLDRYTVVFSGRDGVQAVPLGRQGHTRLLTAEVSAPVQTSDGVAFLRGGWAYFLASPFTGSPRALVPADRLFPMLWPGVVGVAHSLASGAVEVEFIDLQDGTTSETSIGHLPSGYQPVAQFLATGTGGMLRTWGAGSGRGLQLGPTLGRASAVIGTSGTSVAWLAADGCAPDGECPLHVTDTSMATTGDRIIAPPPGQRGFLAGGALSPDGETLASFVAAPDSRQAQAELAIIDLNTGQVTMVSGSTIPVAKTGVFSQWTPDGSVLLFSGVPGTMHAYQAGERRATKLDIQVSDSFAVG